MIGGVDYEQLAAYLRGVSVEKVRQEVRRNMSNLKEVGRRPMREAGLLLRQRKAISLTRKK